jgi:hypothetical protein
MKKFKVRGGGSRLLSEEDYEVLHSHGRPWADARERMSDETEEQLFAMAPAWFDRSREHSLMRFGFECGEGWFELLRELFEAIRALAPTTFSVDQVKQKFGDLRVYVSGETPAIAALITTATEKSRRTCEWCGKSAERGGPPRYSWRVTLCPECQQRRLTLQRPDFH